jgi:hypothetical protein
MPLRRTAGEALWKLISVITISLNHCLKYQRAGASRAAGWWATYRVHSRKAGGAVGQQQVTKPPSSTFYRKKARWKLRDTVFNMGIGMAVICAPENVKILTVSAEAKVIGEVVKQKGEARVIIDGAGYRQTR